MHYILQLLLSVLLMTLQGCLNSTKILPQMANTAPSHMQKHTEEEQDFEARPIEDLKTCFITVEDAECDLCIKEIIKMLKELDGVHDVIVKEANEQMGARFKLFYPASKRLTTHQIKEQLTDYTVSASSLDENNSF